MIETSYLDWNNSIPILEKAYDAGLFVLIIGPKGTGKTSLVREFAKRKNAKHHQNRKTHCQQGSQTNWTKIQNTVVTNIPTG